tara:strand:- start:138 stop:299 length:162 start_codon:yes stop_codon:yes gene_type:complete
MGIANESVDYNVKYIIKANNVEYKTWVPETVIFYKAILDKFNINYTVTKENVT